MIAFQRIRKPAWQQSNFGTSSRIGLLLCHSWSPQKQVLLLCLELHRLADWRSWHEHFLYHCSPTGHKLGIFVFFSMISNFSDNHDRYFPCSTLSMSGSVHVRNWIIPEWEYQLGHRTNLWVSKMPMWLYHQGKHFHSFEPCPCPGMLRTWTRTLTLCLKYCPCPPDCD